MKFFKKFFIYFFIVLFSGVLSLIPIGKLKALEYEWTSKADFNFITYFKKRADSSIFSISSITKDGTSLPAMEIDYGKGNQVSFWDYFLREDYEGKFNESIAAYERRMNSLAERTYYAYPLPGTSVFYLIIDDQAKKVKGIFKKLTVNTCVYRGDTLDQAKSCPWKFYEAYSKWGSLDLIDDRQVYRNGESLYPIYDQSASNETKQTKIYQFIDSVNSGSFLVSSGDTNETTPTGELTAREYFDRFFPEGGSFPVIIKSNEPDPPTIFLQGKDNFDQAKYPNAKRPDMTFELSYVLRARPNSNQLSGVDNYFYFTAEDYPNLAIRIKNCNLEGAIVVSPIKERLSDDVEVGTFAPPEIKFNKDNLYSYLINKVYNNGPYRDECPDANFINWDDNGQLASWGVERVDRDEPILVDTDNKDTCNVSNTGVIGGLLARGLCAILKLIGEIAKFITNVLFTSVFNAYIGGGNVFG